MVTAYILILVFSAWLITHGLVMVGSRLGSKLRLNAGGSASVTALLVALMFLLVVAAPAWALLVTVVVMLVLSRLRLPLFASTDTWLLVLLLAFAPAALPLLGLPGWLAIDASILLATLLGALSASPSLPSCRLTLPAIAALSLSLVAEAILQGGFHAA